MTPKDNLSTIITARKAVLAIARNLRSVFPGESDLSILSILLQNYSVADALTPVSLAAFAKQKKAFTTADVLNEFNVTPQKAAGSLAVLTRKGTLKADKKKKTGPSSAWRWAG